MCCYKATLIFPQLFIHSTVISTCLKASTAYGCNGGWAGTISTLSSESTNEPSCDPFIFAFLTSVLFFGMVSMQLDASAEKAPLMTTGQVEPSPLLNPTSQHHITQVHCMPVASTELDGIAASSQPLNLPSRTPLKTPGGGENSPASSEYEDMELPARAEVAGQWSSTATSSSLFKGLEHQRSGSIDSGKPTSSESSLHTKTGKARKVRFDGVVITSKPPLSRRSTVDTQPQVTHRPRPASSATALSLVDALQRTFIANKHYDASLPRPTRDSLDHDDASIVPQTDVDANSEDEDDQPKLNNHLLAPLSPKQRRLTRATLLDPSVETTDSTSEDTTPAPQAILQRQTKRLRAISYEANAALVDAALGTVLAPVVWEVEPDHGLELLDPVGQWGRAHATAPVSVEYQLPTSILTVPAKPEGSAVLTPYLSRGAKFRQRLDLMFGEDATVRMDKGARPRSAILYDLFTPPASPSRELGPTRRLSESPAASHSDSTDSPSVGPDSSTELTSQASDLGIRRSVKRQLPETPEDNEDGPKTNRPKVEIGEEQISGWISALQRLVKGKVHVHEEALSILSVVLAEIESVKEYLDADGPMSSNLRESLKQLSELQEIPFGDKNHLGQRAQNIVLTWPAGR
ncbi:hypothetical protein BU15DRAFT_60198 [Melanogaster broomeanus]|nr:hypothetical protein BU15DRAFT_60198 [Melanogaster broomeanus]